MKNTASATYEAEKTEIEATLAKIQAALANHAEKQSSDPTHWGYAGDLGHVRAQLADILSFVSGDSQ